jgi:hypothetical protein
LANVCGARSPTRQRLGLRRLLPRRYRRLGVRHARLVRAGLPTVRLGTRHVRPAPKTRSRSSSSSVPTIGNGSHARTRHWPRSPMSPAATRPSHGSASSTRRSGCNSSPCSSDAVTTTPQVRSRPFHDTPYLPIGSVLDPTHSHSPARASERTRAPPRYPNARSFCATGLDIARSDHAPTPTTSTC